ncbi:MAG: dockerin type I domain-containing protein [Planctomycetota bacterium]
MKRFPCAPGTHATYRACGLLAVVGLFFVTGAESVAQTPTFFEPGGTAGGQDWPTVPWTRGAEGTTYAEWDQFFLPGGPNEPDVAFLGFEEQFDANVAETTGLAFVTSGGNIYSFAGATAFDVTMPTIDAGPGFDTYVVLQFTAIGNLPDLQSPVLTAGGESFGFDGQLNTFSGQATGQFGGADVTNVWWWELGEVGADEVLIQFNAAASSMSLTNLVIDTFTTEASALPGDYNGDGEIDAADFVIWQTTFGDTVGDGLAAPGDGADGNGDGLVDGADYAWLRNQLPPGTSATIIAVPEPTSVQTVGVLMTACAFCGWMTWFNRTTRV